jgi:catalase (peroxidase I)
MPHRPTSNRDWWPNQPNLQVLHQPSYRSSLAGEDFRYAEESKTLDIEVLKRDILEVMTTSQDWWPADYGHWRSLTSRAPAARTAVGSQGTRPRRRMRRGRGSRTHGKSEDSRGDLPQIVIGMAVTREWIRVRC